MRQKKLVNKETDTLRLFLVRHGQTDWNIEERFQGQKNIPLNQKGIEQAQKVRDFLADVPIDHVVSSSLSRAKQTAEIIVEGRGLFVNNYVELNEVNHGDWEGSIKADVAQLYPYEFYLWETEPSKALKPNGETLAEVGERVITTWNHLIQDCASNNTQTVLVVAHKVINQIILCYLSGLDLNYLEHFPQNNCAINILDYTRQNLRQVSLQVFNLNVARDLVTT